MCNVQWMGQDTSTSGTELRSLIYVRCHEIGCTGFWDVMLYNVMNIHWCLRGICCLHLQGGRVLKAETGSHVMQTQQQLHNSRQWITEGAKTVCFKSGRGFATANLGVRKVVCGHMRNLCCLVLWLILAAYSGDSDVESLSTLTALSQEDARMLLYNRAL
jgi:hypothetical protein